MMTLSRRPDAIADGDAKSLPQEQRDKLALDLEGATRGVRVDAIIKRCAARHKISVADLLSKSRKAHLVAARREAIALTLEAFPKLSTPQLGEIFNHHHTTILNALGRTSVSRARREAKS